MTMEMLAIILMIVAIVLILLELVWLYVISQNQEEFLRKRHNDISTAKEQIEAVLGSPSANARKNEVQTFLDTATKNDTKFLAGVAAYIEFDKHREKLSEERSKILDQLLVDFAPNERLVNLLNKKNKYEKSYICRCLSDLKATECIEDIRECLKSKEKELQYNAGMALSALGDEEGVIRFLNICEGNKDYSHRVELELIQNFSGSKSELIRHFFEQDKNDDEYMKATIIKAVKNDNLMDLKDIYVEGFQSKSYQVRVACIKAMASLGTPDLEQYLITASKDKDWIIRLSSLTGLEKINSKNAIEAVANVTSDDEWWVRRRASEALLRMDTSMEYVEKVITGYDRYAADAVKGSLYKSM